MRTREWTPERDSFIFSLRLQESGEDGTSNTETNASRGGSGDGSSTGGSLSGARLGCGGVVVVRSALGASGLGGVGAGSSAAATAGLCWLGAFSSGGGLVACLAGRRALGGTGTGDGDGTGGDESRGSWLTGGVGESWDIPGWLRGLRVRLAGYSASAIGLSEEGSSWVVLERVS